MTASCQGRCRRRADEACEVDHFEGEVRIDRKYPCTERLLYQRLPKLEGLVLFLDQGNNSYIKQRASRITTELLVRLGMFQQPWYLAFAYMTQAGVARE